MSAMASTDRGLPAAIQDWLRIHKTLVDAELAFTEVALKAAAGEVSAAELATRREQLVSLRLLCAAIYEKAFPGATPPATY